jgi:hypothetical protein
MAMFWFLHLHRVRQVSFLVVQSVGPEALL